MNGQYYRWTMTKDGKEERFVTSEISTSFWRFTDTQQPASSQTVWRVGDELEMREGEQDEIVGHPTRIQILGFEFDAGAVGTRGAVDVRVRVLEQSELSRGIFDVDSKHLFDSEKVRGAYQKSVGAAALVA